MIIHFISVEKISVNEQWQLFDRTTFALLKMKIFVGFPITLFYFVVFNFFLNAEIMGWVLKYLAFTRILESIRKKKLTKKK